MSKFEGFPPELFGFFRRLEEDNSKAFWSANKTTWEDQVRKPMLAALDDLEAEFGAMRMFRPNRDLRFAKDKSPFKLWTGATSESHAVGGIGYYLSVSATVLTVGYGAMAMTTDQLQRFRAALNVEDSGSAFEKVVVALAAKGLPMCSGAEPLLKKVPAGHSVSRRYAEFLRWRGAAIVKEYERAELMHSPGALKRVRQVWRDAQPLQGWLDRHVGAAGLS